MNNKPDILISIQPKWCEMIANGKKTIEVQKMRPKIEMPFKCYIYCAKGKMALFQTVYKPMHMVGRNYNNIKLACYSTYAKSKNMRDCVNGKVIGEFVCDKIDTYRYHKGLTRFGGELGLPISTYDSYLIFEDDYTEMCLTYDELKEYGKGKTLYGWHISELKIYDKPKELGEFKGFCANKKDCYNDTIRHCNKSHFDWKCNALTRPPQSYMYVEPLVIE